MSKSERERALNGVAAARGGGGGRRTFLCLLLTVCCLLLLGCRQDMQDQPRYEAYEASPFFKDGLASRPLVAGTVARGYLKADSQLYTGQKERAQAGAQAGGNANAQGAAQSGQRSGNANGAGTAQQAGMNGTAASGGSTTQAGGAANADQPAGEPGDVEEFPFPVTQEVMERGRERYQIFCAMCHGFTGDGDGMIVRRGFKQPPSYHEKRLQPPARVGYFFRVITEGFGAMPSYRAQIPVQDRWAIIAYIRALQLSRMNQQTAPASEPAQGEAGGHK